MEYMQRYLDNDLTEEEYVRLMEHLQNDPVNSELFERMKKLSDDLARLPKVTPPYSIVDSIIPKLEEIEAEKRRAEREGNSKTELFQTKGKVSGWSSFIRSYKVWGAAAAVVLLGVVAFSNGLPFRSSSDLEMADQSAGSASVFSGQSTTVEKSKPMLSMTDTRPDTSRIRSEQADRAPDQPASHGYEPSPSSSVAADTEATATDVVEPTPYLQGADESSNDKPVAMTDPSSHSGEKETAQSLEPYGSSTRIGSRDHGEMVERILLKREEHEAGNTQTEPENSHDAVISAYPGPDGSEAYASVSPDGSRTAYVHREEDLIRVSIVEADEKRYISEPYEADEIELYWAEDGSRFTYILIKDDTRTVVQVDGTTYAEIRE